MNNSHNNTLKLVQLSFFIAVIVVLQALGYIVSKFALFPFSISLVMITIVLGGCLLGVKSGIVLGASFGIITFIGCVTGIDAGGFVLFSEHPFITFLLCLIKAIVASSVAAIIYSQMKNKKTVGVVLASASAPFLNTLIFILGMLTIYKNTLYIWAGDNNIFTYAILGLAGINFVIEFLTTTIITPVILPTLEKAVKK